jgi:hypothetical protein
MRPLGAVLSHPKQGSGFGGNPILTLFDDVQRLLTRDEHVSIARPYVLLVALTALCLGCQRTEAPAAGASVTVRLPPARPFHPEPGFSSSMMSNAPAIR